MGTAFLNFIECLCFFVSFFVCLFVSLFLCFFIQTPFSVILGPRIKSSQVMPGLKTDDINTLNNARSHTDGESSSIWVSTALATFACKRKPLTVYF